MMVRFVLAFLFALGSLSGTAQDTVVSQQPLTLDEFFQVVLLNHPVARQAYLLGDLAQARVATRPRQLRPEA